MFTSGFGAVDELTRAAEDGRETQFPYAYHFDAALLARFLTRFGTERGVRHVLDDVLDVALDDHGDISHVVTREHGALTGDLFIDCTGFRGMLINKALGVPFESFRESLPNDSAVALRVPVNGEKAGMRPCTTATAQDAGWIWTIPSSAASGRVTSTLTSTAHRRKPNARCGVRRARRRRSDRQPHQDAHRRCARSWVRNCVAIGLSSGFVEPLESTGIFFIHNAVEQLVKHFSAGATTSAGCRTYNRQVAAVMDGVREFLVLHYYAAARDDNAYWRDAKKRPLPDGLAERIEAWSHRLPDAESVFPRFHGFEPYSYTAMLLGLDGLPVRPPAALSRMDDTAARREFALIRDQAQALAQRLPSQYAYLAHQQNASTGPPTSAA